jgi:murein DD-endopeptidase MepM/ murein hydrolase activator NlpD
MLRMALLSLIGLAACASGGSAPISYGGSTAAPPPQQQRPVRVREEAPPPARPQPAQATPDWADGQGTPLSQYALQPSDAQPFDPTRLPRTHNVGANETLLDIATRYQAPVRALIDQNGLEPPYTLAPGRVLELPPPRLHTVARGETLAEIADRYHVDTRSLALLNRMQPPYEVRRGEQIVLPAMARAREPDVPDATVAPLPRGSGRFAWPLNGDVVARFGSQPGGTHLDGIEIAGRAGAEVRAAADGDVVYAGADIQGLGDLILLRHAENYVTAYAYNRHALVREGQRVRAGQAIAELGTRPDGRARLLFQVRRGSEALDPAPLMGARD